jgi:hypothetical protein
MKSFLTALSLVAATCLLGFLFGYMGKVLFTGTSYPVQLMSKKEITFLRVPLSSPITP